MYGLHLIADWHDCQCDKHRLTELPDIQSLCLQACLTQGLTPVTQAFHSFGTGEGVTGAVVLAESHLALHTWPEKSAVTLDIYVCNFRADNSQRAREVYSCLLAYFQPTSIECHELNRGLPINSPQAPASEIVPTS